MKRIDAFGLVVALGAIMTMISHCALAYSGHWLVICAATPPNVMYVEDSQGRKSGTNPSVSLDKWGGGGTIFEEIPNSFVDDQNIASDKPDTLGQPQDRTGWFVHVRDGGKQNYIIYLRGISVGEDRIDVDAGFKQGPDLPGSQTRVFSQPGSLRRLSVDFNPDEKQLTVNRIVEPENILEDIDVACELGQISPAGICRSLKAKAEAARKDLEGGNGNAALGSLGAFLNELSAQTGKHVKEPAATILREEAEALLKGISGEAEQKKEVDKQDSRAEVPAKSPKHWWWPF